MEGERIWGCRAESSYRRARLERAGRICQAGKGQDLSSGTGRKRVKQKDALMSGSDVEGKRDGGWRVKNGGDDKAGPHG